MNTIEQTETPVRLPRKNGILNRSAVKAYALELSKTNRAGKFTRVSERFLDSVEADVESAIRKIVGSLFNEKFNDNISLLTREAGNRAQSNLEHIAQVIVQRKVQRHPTVGCTLID